MAEQPNGEEGSRPGKRRKRSYKSREEALQEWFRENVRYYDVKEKITLFGFDVSFKWDDENCGSFHMKFDDEACPDEFGLYYEMNGKPCFRGPIWHSPVGVPASYATVEFGYDVREAINAGLAILLPRAKPFGLDAETGTMINIGTPLMKRLPPQHEIERVEKKLSEPFFFLEIPIET